MTMGSSKIMDIQTKVLNVPLKNPWKISLYKASTRSHAFVRIRTEDGVVGYGETSPSPSFMGETGDTIKLVIDSYIKPVLLGRNIFDLESIHQRMDQVLCGNKAAKSTVDIALFDAIGKTVKRPVYELLGGMYRTDAPLSWVVGMQDLEGSLQEAKDKVAEGYKVIKLKVGVEPKTDYELVKKVRDEIGADIPIRLDANQGYERVAAVTLFRKLEEFGLESIEQPVPKWDLDGMRYLIDKLKTPIMADESVSSADDLHQVVNADAADIVNIKVGKVGGLYCAKKIAAYLELAGLSATVGSNLELGLGTAASAHFAVSTKVVNLPSDLIIGSYLHTGDIIETGFKNENGAVIVPRRPGLGVDVDDAIFEA